MSRLQPTASSSTSTRPPSVQSNRPTSVNSLYSSASVPKTPRLTSSRHGTLSQSEVNKISNTIASARQSTTVRLNRQISDTPTEAIRANPIASGSYLAESSFVNAPLNSRLPPVSPRRRSNGKSTSRVDVDRINKAFSQAVPPGEEYFSEPDDDDDLIFEEELVRKRREGLEKESLEGLSLALQEAFITEDLLSVLSGIEGQYIEFALDYNPEDVNERLEGARFVVDPLLDPSLTSLVTRLLPLATHYISLTAFLSEYTTLQSGVTNHALGAAMREFLREYLILIANMEQQFNGSSSFTLQRLWFYLNPSLHTLSLLSQLTHELIETSIPPASNSDSDSDSDSDGGKFGGKGLKAAMAGMMGKPVWQSGLVKGGEILAIISGRRKKTSGDPVALELYSNLLLQASQPYLAILLRWITTGELIDLYGEFMVVENFGLTRKDQEEDYTDEYWETRYTLRDSVGAKGLGKPRERGLSGGAVIPDFLENWKNKILLAGKYLNVIRECGRAAEVRGIVAKEEECVKMDDEGFYRQIDEAYTYANKTLLHLLIDDEHLVDRLRSVKSHFFLQPPLFTSFLAAATYELKKRVAHVSVSKLQSLLEVALRTDGGEEELKVRLEKTTLVEFLLQVVGVNGSMSEGLAQASGQGDDRDSALTSEAAKAKAKEKSDKNPLTGTTALSISMNIPFPLSLILSKQTTLRYQILFRHLLSLRTLSQLLANNWSTHHKSPIWRTIPAKLENWEELNQFKRRIFSVRMRMAGWIGAIEGFVVGEVLESGWIKLEKKLENCQTVDELLREHVDFLDSCLKGALLTDKKLLELHAKIMQTCTLFTSYINHFENYIKVAVTAATKNGGDFEKVDLVPAWEFLKRFEGNFNHSASIYLERVTYHAGRENSSILPLMVRLTSIKIPDTAKGITKP